MSGVWKNERCDGKHPCAVTARTSIDSIRVAEAKRPDESVRTGDFQVRELTEARWSNLREMR